MVNMCESSFYRWIFFSNVKGSINHIKSGHFCLACWVSRAVPCSNPFKFPQSMPSIWLVFVFFMPGIQNIKLRALNACKHRGNHKISNVKLQMDSRFWESNISVCNQPTIERERKEKIKELVLDKRFWNEICKCKSFWNRKRLKHMRWFGHVAIDMSLLWTTFHVCTTDRMQVPYNICTPP